MKNTLLLLALSLLALAALPALAADPATNAPAATPARAEDDMRGETFERWRFTIPPGVLDALEEACGELKNFFGELGVSWPPGSSIERSGDDGLVVRNTRENLNLIRMIIDALPVTVLQGDPVVLADAPATNAPAATPAAAFDTTLFAAFATNVPCWPPPESPSFDEVLHALPDFASFRTGRGWGVPTEPLPPELDAAVRESLRRAVRTDTPPEALRFGTERETWPEDGWCVDAHWHTAAFEARFPGRGFCPFGDGSGGSYSERFLAYRSPDSAEDALFALFPGTYRAPGLAALLDRAHPPSGAAEETHAESAEPEPHAESAKTADP